MDCDPFFYTMSTCENIVRRTNVQCTKPAKSVVNGKSLCGLHSRSQKLLEQKNDDVRNRSLNEWRLRIYEQVQLEERSYIEWGATLLAMDPFLQLELQEHPEIATLWLNRYHAYENVKKVLARTKTILRRCKGINKNVVGTIVEDERNGAMMANQGMYLLCRLRARDEVRELERLAEEQRVMILQQPITFVRDPVGDIALNVFGTDNQNVHRSSIQNATNISIQQIMEKPLRENLHTFLEIQVAFHKFPYWLSVMDELQKDISVREVIGFGFSYKDVLDHIWSIITTHVHKDELIVRLYQEISDGYGMCPNGKICRLINVLQGYDDSIIQSVSRDAFQSKFATLINVPTEKRLSAAKLVLADYSIPNEEWLQWIEPLMES